MNKDIAQAIEAPTAAFKTTRWTIFTLLMVTYILVYFHRMAPGVASEFLMADFGITGTELGSLSAVYFIIYAVMQLPSGVIADTLGTRTSIVSGNFVAGIGSILFGFAGSFEAAYAGRFLVGLGVSVIFVSIMKSNSVWFHEKVFGLVSGLTVLFGNFGSILAAGPLAMMLGTFDWRTVFMGIGCFSIILSLVAFLFVRNKPEDMGFPSPNTYATDTENSASGNWIQSLAGIMKVPAIWPGFWILFGMVGSMYSFMGLWGIPYLRDIHGLNRTHAADHMTAMLVCFAVGSLFFGWFSDKIGRRKPLIIGSTALYTAAWLYLMYGPWQAGMGGFALFGALGFFGSGFVLIFAVSKEVITPSLSGMAISIVNCGCFIGTAIMQTLFGYIADLTWQGTVTNGVRVYAETDYHNGFIAMLVFTIIALVASLRITETRCRNITM